jgi:hypothetical protein
MVELTKEQREAVKREHDALVDYKWCDERRGDGDRGF